MINGEGMVNVMVIFNGTVMINFTEIIGCFRGYASTKATH